MGKSYRKVNRWNPISESTSSDHSRKFSSRAKRHTHHQVRRINDSTDWVNSEKELPCTSCNKSRILKFGMPGIMDHPQIVSHKPSLSLTDVLEPMVDPTIECYKYREIVDIPKWRDESTNVKTQLESIIQDKTLENSYRYGAKMFNKQLERRKKLGVFKGHDRTKDYTMPPFDC